MIIRGTTPNHVFNIPFPIDDIVEAYITYSQDGRIVIDKRLEEFNDVDIYNQTLSIQLTQGETMGFVVNEKPRENIVTIQLKLLFKNEIVCTSRPIREKVIDTVRDGKIYAQHDAEALGDVVVYDGGTVEGW